MKRRDFMTRSLASADALAAAPFMAAARQAPAPADQFTLHARFWPVQGACRHRPPRPDQFAADEGLRPCSTTEGPGRPVDTELIAGTQTRRNSDRSCSMPIRAKSYVLRDRTRGRSHLEDARRRRHDETGGLHARAGRAWPHD